MMSFIIKKPIAPPQIPEIVNNLASDETDKTLAAAMGKYLKQQIDNLALVCPFSVNQVIEFAVDINPNLLYTNTTWVRFAEGQTTIGYKASDTDFGVVGSSGGKKGHKMTILNLVKHKHGIPPTTPESAAFNAGGGSEHRTNSTGSTQVNETGEAGQDNPEDIPTLPPYIVTAKWRRTA